MPIKFPANRDHTRRYRIIAEVKSRTRTTIGWRAADLAFGDDVAIYPVPTDFLADTGQVAAFDTAFARISGVANPGMIRWHSIDMQSRLAVREWVNGFTLLDLLRRQRKLTALEAFALLDGLPGLLDWLSTRGVTPPSDLLEESWVAFQPAVPTAEMLKRPMSEWPPHQIKLALLHPRDFWNQSAEISSQATFRSDEPSSDISVRLARLLRELLGDRLRSKPWRPMPMLNERANELLADTLNGKTWQSARDFWTAIVTAAADSGPQVGRGKARAESFIFSVPSACQPERCRVAMLEPEEHAHPSIKLCGGSAFRFGRAESLADFRTALLPETPENDKLSGEVSREHARIEARDGALWLCDGDGETASRNGTQWNDVALPAKGAVRMHGRGVLDLANQYRVALTPVQWEFAREMSLGGRLVCPPASTLPWGVIPRPLGEQQPLCRAVWVLTALGFHLSASGDIEWHDGGSIPPVGIFIRDNHGFWLANTGFPPRAIRVGEAEPRPGDAAPLLPGQSLRIGDRIYNVSIRD